MQSDFDFPSYLWLPLHLVAGSVLKLGHASGPNSYMLKHYRLSGAHKDKMVTRCLPVFKVSALLITPPPPNFASPTFASPHMCFIFPLSHVHTAALLISYLPISLFSNSLSPSCISCGVYSTVCVSNWNHIGTTTCHLNEVTVL